MYCFVFYFFFCCCCFLFALSLCCCNVANFPAEGRLKEYFILSYKALLMGMLCVTLEADAFVLHVTLITHFFLPELQHGV